jgi:murein L,D-transpeptidase YafK
MLRKLLASTSFVFAITYGTTVYAQQNMQDFKNFQMSCARVSGACSKYNDTLRNAFTSKGLDYPCKDIYIRAFKSQNEMELWGRNAPGTEYRLVKTMHICAISGILGPKRTEGDRQVPEGFYFIQEFNPKSDYYLSLLLNYPNYSDQMRGYGKLGGDIYIHGGCVTIGCMPMTNEGIEELYTACLNARINGQENIPVHVFPTRLTKAGMTYLTRQFPNDKIRQAFWSELKGGYEYFEKTHKLLPVMYTPDGKYAY